MVGFNMRSGEFYFIKTPTVILTAGAVGKFGLPRDGYLSGVYEFPEIPARDLPWPMMRARNW